MLLGRRVAASPLLMYSNRICREARRASGRAGTLCQREPQVVRAVVAGARLGLRECRHQFTRRRWDCSVPRKYFGRILQQDVRETAFVNAITSAGVTFAVTKACSLGELPQCGCEDPRGRQRPNGFLHTPVVANTRVVAEAGGVQGVPVQDVWEWGGCGDDVAFGFKKSRIYLDRRRWRGAGDLKTLIDLHNNEAGRLAVRDHMRIECKCHGLSGSCAMRTCWKKMPPFREVGDHLKLCSTAPSRCPPATTVVPWHRWGTTSSRTAAMICSTLPSHLTSASKTVGSGALGLAEGLAMPRPLVPEAASCSVVHGVPALRSP
uniref:Protein Wnt n=1 Tax=Eptatretus burgeri TaxID=7764 RepID=A0A8C4R7Q3_EPTBU